MSDNFESLGEDEVQMLTEFIDKLKEAINSGNVPFAVSIIVTSSPEARVRDKDSDYVLYENVSLGSGYLLSHMFLGGLEKLPPELVAYCQQERYADMLKTVRAEDMN